MESFNWLFMVGGLAFFFFGLNSARYGLRMAAGDRLRTIMGKVTNNRFSAIITGAVLTIILQSSSATTVILVSFAETQLITLTQAIGLILGADIGTTLVVILLSFKKITEYSLLLVAFGIFLETVVKKKTVTKYVGHIILGFGLIFYGMHMMSSAAYPLRDNEMATKVFEFLAMHPGWNLIFATIFTAVIQTSAATIGMAIALSFAGVLGFEAAIPIVLGANVGTCITAGLASLSSGIEGKRVAIAHVVVKVLAVAIIFPFIDYYATFVNNINAYIASFWPLVANDISGKIALTHLLFNICLAAAFAPLVKPLAVLIQKILPAKKKDEEEFKPKYLDETALDTPTLAFAQAKREILRIASLTQELFGRTLNLFKRNIDIDAESESVGSLDDKIDILEKAIRFYVAKISQKSLTEEQAKSELNLLTIASELEDIGDIISKEIVSLAKKKAKTMRIFSDEGWAELKKFHKLVNDNFDLMVSMLTHPHEDIALKAGRHEEHLNTVEQDYRHSHLQRLHEGMHESFETSSIHLDTLGNMRMINSKLTKIVKIALTL